MNAVPLQPRKWSSTFRWIVISLIFVVHIGLIFALGDRKALTARPPSNGIALSLASEETELFALNNASLLALPHHQGFAGEAWLQPPAIQFPPFRWIEPSRELPLAVRDLGVAFSEFMQTNVFASLQFQIKPPSDLPLPVASEITLAGPNTSVLVLGGDIRGRRLLHPPALQPIPTTDLLTNTVVQVLVTPEGEVMSFTLMSRSGSPAADQRAIEVSRAARFDRQRVGPPGLRKGALIFEWHGVPAPAAAKPTP